MYRICKENLFYMIHVSNISLATMELTYGINLLGYNIPQLPAQYLKPGKSNYLIANISLPKKKPTSYSL